MGGLLMNQYDVSIGQIAATVCEEGLTSRQRWVLYRFKVENHASVFPTWCETLS